MVPVDMYKQFVQAGSRISPSNAASSVAGQGSGSISGNFAVPGMLAAPAGDDGRVTMDTDAGRSGRYSIFKKALNVPTFPQHGAWDTWKIELSKSVEEASPRPDNLAVRYVTAPFDVTTNNAQDFINYASDPCFGFSHPEDELGLFQ